MKTLPLWASLLLSVLLLVIPAASAAHPREMIPAGHWAYAALRQLAASGLVSFHRLAVQPLSRDELAEVVRQARQGTELRDVTSGMLDLIRALEREFLRGEGDQIFSQLKLRSGAGMTGRTGYPFAAADGVSAIGLGAAWGEWMLWTEFGTGDDAAVLNRFYASGRSGTVDLVLGRDALRWGGSSRTTLFLDAHAGNLDAFRLSLNWPSVRLAKVFGLLSASDSRYLSGTRIDWQPAPGFRMGITELAIVRPGPLIPYWILNPFPLVITGPAIVKLQDWAGSDDNPLGGLDFDLLVWPGFVLSGQIVADDLNWGHSPNRYGWQLGAFWANPFRTQRTSLRVEYSMVTNWTYTSLTGSGNHFLHAGHPLGFWLGNDADDLYAEVSHVLSPDLTLSGWLARTRHGEGRIGVPWPSAAVGFEKWWLSGVVETRYAAGLMYEIRSARGATKYWAEIGNVSNVNNVSGINAWDYRLGIEVAHTW